MSLLDSIFESRARELARRTGRRTFLGRLGLLLVGGAALPLLPISRAAGQPTNQPRPVHAGARILADSTLAQLVGVESAQAR